MMPIIRPLPTLCETLTEYQKERAGFAATKARLQKRKRAQRLIAMRSTLSLLAQKYPRRRLQPVPPARTAKT